MHDCPERRQAKANTLVVRGGASESEGMSSLNSLRLNKFTKDPKRPGGLKVREGGRGCHGITS